MLGSSDSQLTAIEKFFENPTQTFETSFLPKTNFPSSKDQVKILKKELTTAVRVNVLSLHIFNGPFLLSYVIECGWICYWEMMYGKYTTNNEIIICISFDSALKILVWIDPLWIRFRRKFFWVWLNIRNCDITTFGLCDCGGHTQNSVAWMVAKKPVL